MNDEEWIYGILLDINTHLYEKLCQHAKFEGRRYLLCHEQLLQWVSMLLLAHLSTLPEYEDTYTIKVQNLQIYP